MQRCRFPYYAFSVPFPLSIYSSYHSLGYTLAFNLFSDAKSTVVFETPPVGSIVVLFEMVIRVLFALQL